MRLIVILAHELPSYAAAEAQALKARKAYPQPKYVVRRTSHENKAGVRVHTIRIYRKVKARK